MTHTSLKQSLIKERHMCKTSDLLINVGVVNEFMFHPF